jgi:pSer/pThr/pTyr-binding forkhead associated (FHA) protein
MNKKMARDDDTRTDFNNDRDFGNGKNLSDTFGESNGGAGGHTLSFDSDGMPIDDSSDNTKTRIIDPEKISQISNAWIVITKGRNSGKEHQIPPQHNPGQRRISIGRDSINDIVIDDPAVSGEHAFIIFEKNIYTIGDAGSINGTFLNGKEISAFRKLTDGDTLLFGETEYEFKCVELFNKVKPKISKSAIKTKKTAKKTVKKQNKKTVKKITGSSSKKEGEAITIK